jgi:hypothetical protein
MITIFDEFCLWVFVIVDDIGNSSNRISDALVLHRCAVTVN